MKYINICKWFCFILMLKCTVTCGCPVGCHCSRNIVSCRTSGLHTVPFGIANNTERLYLQHNNINRVTRNDLAGLTELRKLHLNGNRITCIQDGSFQSLVNLEILLLNNNNISSIPSTVFGQQPVNLRMINLNSNPLNCNCQHIWLLEWMQLRPSLTVSSSCFISRNEESFETVQLECEDAPFRQQTNCETMSCPSNCVCGMGVVDCRNRNLVLLPVTYPSNITELHLEQNLIQTIPTMAFSHYRNLRRIDLSNNAIEEIQPDAFKGLYYLTSLVLYGNEITTFPPDVFKGLKNLQMLLLNANKIRCLRHDVFSGLTALNLLSLYDNSLQHLVRGTFESLQSIETLHLAQNPFICDCKLRWLTKYLKKNPVETSGAKCAGPSKLTNKKIALIKGRRFRCHSASRKVLENAECLPDVECPQLCHCDATSIDCSAQYKNLSHNNISFITNNRAFEKLRNAKRLDLSHNNIGHIEEGAFVGAVNLVELHLNNNLINTVRGSFFHGLENLRILIIRNNKILCVHNDSFDGLSSLEHLSLYGNKITTIMIGSLTALTSLQTLNLLANPLNCNCHMDWFGAWLRGSAVATGNLRCAVPTFLAGLPISDINSQDFQCNPIEGNYSVCSYFETCPSGCMCQALVVQCGNAGLTKFPVTEISQDVSELYINNNDIMFLPLKINELVFLTTLDLSNNSLVTIREHQFSQLKKLQTLLLAHNKIRCVSQTSFSGLVFLRSLSLQGNNLSSLPEGVFNSLPLLRNVGLSANPWYCNCRLRWLSHTLDQVGIARCFGPQNMKGRLIATSTADMFVCQGAIDIDIDTKCNPCLSSPCGHNSTCTVDMMQQYSCHCQTGSLGRNCEVSVGSCGSLPCLNGGTCVETSEVDFVCNCIDGFEGKQCEVNIDDCRSNPCTAKNATCIDEMQSYTCRCAPGWQGENCSKVMSNACMPINPCLNGAECVMENSGDASYRCLCPVGYYGKNCSRNACYYNGCQNGGVCVINNHSDAGYHCHCHGMFRGRNCSVPVIDVLVQDDPCSHAYCLNGGECYHKQESGKYGCWCPPGYSGITCEKLSSLNIQENGSYVQLHSMSDQNMNITVFLSTLELFGIIFYKGYVHSSNHVAVEFYSGHIRLSIDLGNFPGSTLYSSVPINDGKLHKVQIIIYHGSVSLNLDDLHTVRVNVGTISEDTNEYMTPFFVAGVQGELLTYAKKMIHIRNSTSFRGCIDALYFNQSKINFNEFLPNEHQITPGCTEDLGDSTCSLSRCGNHGNCQYRPDYGIHCVCDSGYTGTNCNQRTVNMCDGHLCQHGSCVALKQEYKCKCAQGYTGKYCRSHVCSKAKCNRGTCIPTEDGYKCKCQRHYSGEHCEDRIRKCRGTRIKQFFDIRQKIQAPVMSDKEHNKTRMCRSKRRYTNILCNSNCSFKDRTNRKTMFFKTGGILCCQPFRIQQKRVRMKCDDGSNIFEVVQKVRRCACKQCNHTIP